MACCNYCYEQYINEDKSFDKYMIEKIEKKSKEDIEKYNKENPQRSKPLVFKPVSCRCECHVKGWTVLH